MERSTSIPFSLGEIGAKLVITGPIVTSTEAEKRFDLIFGKAIHLVTNDVVHALGRIEEQVVVGEGTTEAETLLEFELLGNKVELSISTKLSIEVSRELIRTWVASIMMSGFAEYALRVINRTALEAILDDPEQITIREIDDNFRMPGIVVIGG